MAVTTCMHGTQAPILLPNIYIEKKISALKRKNKNQTRSYKRYWEFAIKESLEAGVVL